MSIMQETGHVLLQLLCKHDRMNASRMWKRVVWLEGKKEEEGAVPSTWVVGGSHTAHWSSKVNAHCALTNREDLDPKIRRKFPLLKVKIASGKYTIYTCTALSIDYKCKRLVTVLRSATTCTFRVNILEAIANGLHSYISHYILPATHNIMLLVSKRQVHPVIKDSYKHYTRPMQYICIRLCFIEVSRC